MGKIFGIPLVLLANLAFSIFSIAQNSPGLKSFTPPSPNASSLGKYGEVPVSFYTGVPSISIPLHTLKSRELEVPISLSYHAGGIKVEELASWVGLGWSLSAGGAITRSVRGLPDDMNLPGYFNATVRNTINTLAQTPIYLNYAASPYDFIMDQGNGIQADRTVYDQILAQLLDSESDIFFFSCGKYSGKFYMDMNGNFVSIPIQAMKIEYVLGALGVARWKLTMVDGVQFVFGQSMDLTRNAYERNVNDAATNPITAWYLVEIISPQNDRIDLYYNTENYVYSSKSSEVINTLVSGQGIVSPLPLLDKKITINNIQGVSLNRISCSTGDIVFNPSSIQRTDLPLSYSLQSIDVRDPQTSILKSFRFTYGYFVSPTGSVGSPYTNRLRLDQVETLSPDGLTGGGKHQFEYNSLKLPSWDPQGIAINSQDMWGFHNGVTNNVLPRGGTITYSTNQHVIMGADRHSDELAMQACMLTKITYPTGGYSYFDYEANKLYTSSVELGQTEVEINSRSEGLVLVTGDVGKTTDFSVGLPWPTGASTATVTVNVRQQVHLCPVDLNSGLPTCFEAYIEGRNLTQFTRQYLQEGTTTYQLPGPGDYKIVGSTFPGFEATISNNPMVYYVNLAWAEQPAVTSSPYSLSDKTVGGLRIKRITNNSNGTTSIKKYLYSKLTENTSSGVAVNINMLTADFFENVTMDNNVVYTSDYVQSKSTTMVPLIPSLGGVVGYANVTELIGENGEGGKTEYTFTTANDYPDEKKVFRPYPQSCSYDWRRGLLLKKTVYRNDSPLYSKVSETVNAYTFGTSTKIGYGLAICKDLFGSAPNILANNYYVSGYRTVSEFSYQQTETARSYDQVNPSAYSETVKTFNYGSSNYLLTKTSVNNSKGKLMETISKYPPDVALSGEQETARLNLVNNFILSPVLEQDVNQDQVLLTKTINDYKVFNGMALLSSISQQIATAPLETRVVMSYYDNFGNVLQQSKKDDFQHSYIWDYNSAYPIAEIANALSADVAYTSFEADGKGNWTIPSYTPNSIEARTGKQSYSLSSGAISKSGLVLNRKYVISFWAKTGATVSLNGSSVIPTLDPAINSWEYYETSLIGSPTVTSATISGTGTIDELRLFPDRAQMTTYTFTPGIGMSSATDANNVKTYFEYDVLGRLAIVKDDQGKILKTYKYNYKQ